jgi:hypothetical protein
MCGISDRLIGLRNGDISATVHGMSLAEMKEQVEKLTEDERLELQALLIHLARKDDPEYLAEMEGRMERMDRGEKFNIHDIEKILGESLSAPAPAKQ